MKTQHLTDLGVKFQQSINLLEASISNCRDAQLCGQAMIELVIARRLFNNLAQSAQAIKAVNDFCAERFALDIPGMFTLLGSDRQHAELIARSVLDRARQNVELCMNRIAVLNGKLEKNKGVENESQTQS